MERAKFVRMVCAEPLATVLACSPSFAQQPTVPRLWVDGTLDAIRSDFARPPIHARNLFQLSAAMYDAWAVYDTAARPWLMGNTVHGFPSPGSSTGG